MKSIQIEKHGGIEVLKFKELTTPKPKGKEVLVKNEYCGINYIDIYHRTGIYPLSLPTILGREAGGIVEQVGEEVKEIKTGDKVGYFSPNSYSTHNIVEEEKLIKLPSNISTETAAASILQGLTAITLVHSSAKVTKDDWVLVHAAAGGVGSLLVQICKMIGAKVIATTSNKEKEDIVKELGADHIINYTVEDVAKKVLEITNEKGVNVILDGVGKDTFKPDLECASLFARIVCFGNASGKIEPFDLLLLTKKNLSISRPTLGNFLLNKEDAIYWTNLLWKYINDGMKVHIFKVYDLKDVAQAHSDLESRKTIGKLLLKC